MGQGNAVNAARHASTPKGVAAPPQGAVDGSDAFYDWLATQPSATREWYIEGRYNAVAGSGNKGPGGSFGSWSANDRKNAAHAEQDRLQAAQQKALSQGKTLPDVNPQTGEGVHFSSDKAKAQFLETARTRNTAENQATAQGITPESITVHPTLDQGYAPALHPENLIQGYTPEQEQAIAQQRTDATGEQAAKQSLQDYTSAINQGGLTAIDRARLEQARSQRAMEARAAEGAIRQQAEQQGRAGSTASLVMRQRAQQGAENARSQDDLQTMALGLQRKDTLMGQRGTLGTQVQTLDDAIDHFNTEGARETQKANQEAVNKAREHNVDTANQAVGAGLAYGAGLSAQNTGITNQAEYANKGKDYGARGALGEQEQATGLLGGAQSAQASGARGDFQDAEHLKAQEEALGWNLGATALGATVGPGITALSKVGRPGS